MAIQSGYDPAAGPALFRRLMERQGERERAAATTPAGEVARAVGGTLESFFRSHPMSGDRIRHLEAVASAAPGVYKGKSFYVGRRNLRERVPLRMHPYADEYRVWQ